jgi:hypothetical protein
LATITDQPIQPDEFTAKQFQASTGKTNDSARHLLNRARDRGELTSRTGTVDGHTVTIYKRAI